MRIGFLVGDIAGISGGSNVILEYAAGLVARGHHVILIPQVRPAQTHAAWHPRLKGIPIVPLAEFEAGGSDRFDYVFATWWPTWFDLGNLPSRVYGYLNQSLECRFHDELHHKLLNRITYSLPMLFVTEARWLAEYVRQVQPEAPALLIENGLSSEFFPLVEKPPLRQGPLRILVEGPWSVPFKGVPETFALIESAALRFPLDVGWLSSDAGDHRPSIAGRPVNIFERIPIDRVANVMQEYDVLIKLSRVEGVFGPPLEMFSQGGTAITSTVTGSDEYMRHGHNGFLVEPWNMNQVVKYLELLSEDRELLMNLRTNALATARSHPSWRQSTEMLHAHLVRLHDTGYSNESLRPALQALSAIRGHWLKDVWRGEGSSSPDWSLVAPHIGPGELLLLRRYRKLKGATIIRGALDLVPGFARRRLRAMLSKVLS